MYRLHLQLDHQQRLYRMELAKPQNVVLPILFDHPNTSYDILIPPGYYGRLIPCQ